MIDAGELRGTGRRSVRVLVVEDDPIVRMLLHLVFEDEGYQVIAVSNGAEALAALHHTWPQVVLLDLDLPIVTGEHVAATMRVSHGPPVPVIVLSGASDGHVRAERAGATAYFAKPFDLDTVVAYVETIVGV